MDFAKSLFEVIRQLTSSFSFCIDQLMQAPACKPLWTWTTITVLALGALAIIVVSWKTLSYRMKLAAALRAEKERARVDHEAIAAKSWDGDKAYRSDLGNEEIERRIREAVEQSRAAHPAFPELAPPRGSDR